MKVGSWCQTLPLAINTPPCFASSALTHQFTLYEEQRNLWPSVDVSYTMHMHPRCELLAAPHIRCELYNSRLCSTAEYHCSGCFQCCGVSRPVDRVSGHASVRASGYSLARFGAASLARATEAIMSSQIYLRDPKLSSFILCIFLCLPFSSRHHNGTDTRLGEAIEALGPTGF